MADRNPSSGQASAGDRFQTARTNCATACVRLVGSSSLAATASTGDLVIFVLRSVLAAGSGKKLLQRIRVSIFEMGVRCLWVICVVGLFTGLVLGLQGYHVLSRFGSEGMLGSMVSLTLVRELAPVLAALMIVGQAGSALAAELGAQRNSEQIDALGTMGISPLGYLVTPRLLASVVTFPILTALFALVGLWGGYISSSIILPLESGLYWSSVEAAVQPKDLQEAIIKSLVFGFLTIAICAHRGFFAHRQKGVVGAQAVSMATTRAVVSASIAVLASDYLITSLLVS